MNTLKMIFMMYFKLAFQKNKGHIVIWKQKSLFRRLFLYLSRRMRLVDIRRSPPGIRNQKLVNWSMIKIQCGRNKVNWWFLWSIDLWSFSLTGLVLRCICLPPLSMAVMLKLCDRFGWVLTLIHRTCELYEISFWSQIILEDLHIREEPWRPRLRE